MSEPQHSEEFVLALTRATLEVIKARGSVEYPFSQSLKQVIKKKVVGSTKRRVTASVWPEIYNEIVKERNWAFEKQISRQGRGSYKNKKRLQLTRDGQAHLDRLNGLPRLISRKALQANNNALFKRAVETLIELVEDHVTKPGNTDGGFFPKEGARQAVAKALGYSDFEAPRVYGNVVKYARARADGIAEDSEGKFYVPKEILGDLPQKDIEIAKATSEPVAEPKEIKRITPSGVELTYTLGVDGTTKIEVKGATVVFDPNNRGDFIIEDATGSKFKVDIDVRWTLISTLALAILVGGLISAL